LTQIRTVKDALPGRVLYLDIWPLSQAEIEGSATRVIDRLMDGMIPTVRDAPIGPLSYVERFVRGGFPGPLRGSPLIRRRFFDSYVDSVVERDVPDIAALRSLDSPGRILRLLSARSATLLNVASLARDLQLDNKTVDHHLRILSDLMLIRLHRPWFANLGSRQTKAPKIYVSDPGLMAALAGADRRGIARNPAVMGSFLETAVCMEILRLAATADHHIEMFHYRDKKQREVDIVLERSDGALACIEVKAGATSTASDFRSLRYLREGLADRFVAGVVLHCGSQTLPFGDRLAAVPISALWTQEAP
jgi:predicted AAA+ superfamily ATPase